MPDLDRALLDELSGARARSGRMRNVLAIARLTFREGVRMRIVLVFVILLAFIMLWLPFTVRGDQTVTGQLQTFLSYSLGAVGLLLGLATVFLSCSTLTAEFRSMTLHLVLTKPVSRFEVLAGKWLGINALMLLLLGLSGATIYGFAVLIKNRPANFERDKLNVRDVVWQAARRRRTQAAARIPRTGPRVGRIRTEAGPRLLARQGIRHRAAHEGAGNRVA